MSETSNKNIDLVHMYMYNYVLSWIVKTEDKSDLSVEENSTDKETPDERDLKRDASLRQQRRQSGLFLNFCRLYVYLLILYL